MGFPRIYKETSLFKPNAISDEIASSITVAKAEIKVTTDAISSAVSRKAESTTVDGLANRLSTAETSITQQAGAIALKANASDVYTKTGVDGLISTEVQNRDAAISASASAIALSVSNTYATQVSLNTEANQRKALYGTCSTAAGTAAKAVTCSGFSLYTGATVSVTFSNANTASSPTLNVNSTGAKPIRSFSGAALSAGEYKWAAGSTLQFVYDGSYWRLQDAGTVKRLTAAEASITVNAGNIEAKVSKDGVISSINQSAESVTINAGKVDIAGAAIFTSGRLSTSNLNNAYDAKGSASAAEANARAAIPSKVSQLANDSGYQTSSQVSTAVSNGVSGKADKTAAVSEEQLIYISKASGTNSVSANTTWVTSNSDSQNAWTVKRPTYNSSYPVLFVAKQRKTVSGAVTCTTPIKDDTTTVIDGGRIVTGTIDASVVAVTKLNASNITSGTLSADRIAANSLAIGKVNGLQTALNGKETAGAASSALASAQDYADQKMLDAVSDASSDATNKANAAAKTATNYITHVDNNGITVHPSSTTNNRAAINANGLEVFRTNTSVALFGETSRIGTASGRNVKIDSDSVDICNGTAVLATFEADNVSIGAASNSATVKLCNQRGVLTGQATTKSNSTVPGLKVQANGMLSLNWSDFGDANDIGGIGGMVCKQLWSGNIASGGSVTINDTGKYTMFACEIGNPSGTAIGFCLAMGTYSELTFGGQRDDGTTRFYKATFTRDYIASGPQKTWKLNKASVHEHTGTGISGALCNVYTIWGIL